MGSEKNLKIYALLIVLGLLGTNIYGENYEVLEEDKQIGIQLNQGDGLTNYGIIQGSDINFGNYTSNIGVYGLGNNESGNGNFSNIGTIQGKDYGVYLENIALESFNNTGLINGIEKDTNTRGMTLKEAIVNTFNSDGMIKSTVAGTSLTIENTTIGTFENTGSIQGGLHGLTIANSKIENLLNKGIIIGGWIDLGIVNTEIDKIENTGHIQGFSIETENELEFTNTGSISNGVTYFDSIYKGKIFNSGTMYGGQRGLSLRNLEIDKIENNGMIDGATGIYLEHNNQVNDINNLGNISNILLVNDENLNESIESIIGSVNNIGKIGSIKLDEKEVGDGVVLEKINNTGLITGINTVDIGNINSKINQVDNYGVVTNIITDSSVGGNITEHKITSIENKGITQSIDKDKKIEIKIGAVGQTTEINNIIYTIVNGTTDGELRTTTNEETLSTSVNLYTKVGVLNENEYLIINGLSKWNDGALVVDETLNLTNSIINDGGDGSAVLLNGNSFAGSNVIINGGKQSAIKGLNNDDIVSLDTNTIVNGNIDLGNGENLLTIDSSIVNGDILLGTGKDNVNVKSGTTINGEVKMGEGADILTLDGTVTVNMNLDSKESDESVLDGGEGVDILNLGSENENLNVLYTIANFETININGNVTLFEAIEENSYKTENIVPVEVSKITGAENIIIGVGDLTLRVDSTKRNDANEIIGHALYENKGMITSGEYGVGSLIIGLNGLGVDSIVDMGGTAIDANLDNNVEGSDALLTNSIVLDAVLNENGDVLITVKENIPSDPGDKDNPVNASDLVYEKQNSVYKSIVSAGEIGKLAPTTEIESSTGDYYTEVINQQAQLLSLLDQIYANSPYAYTLKTTREGMKTVEENMSYLTIKPKADKWLTQGKGFYTNSHSDNKADSKNYHGYDQIGTSRNYDTSTYSKGGLATFEYGLTDISSIGFVFAGYDQNIDLSGASEMKSDSIYLGGYLKKEFGNIRLMGGIGGQYTSSNGERVMANENQVLRTVGNYSSNSLSAYIEGRYDYQLNETISIRPKARLSGYMVKQGDVNEGYSADTLSIQVDKEKAFTGEAELGFDIVKESYKKSGKLKSTLSLSGIYAKGDGENEELTGRVTGTEKLGSDFGIEGAEIPEYSGKVSYDLEYEKYNGKIFTIGVSYEVSDIDNNLNMSIGYGYKF